MPASPAPDTVPGSGAVSGTGVGVVPGSGAIPTPAPPRPGAVPGSQVAQTTPALDAVPGNRAISDAVPGLL